MKKLPLTEKDFQWHKLTPKQIEKVGQEAVAYKKASYKKIKEILPEERTYENTMYALEISDGPAGDMLRKVSLLGEVSPKKEVRDAAYKVSMEVSSQMVDIEYDRDLYISLLEYYEGNFRDEKKTLGKDDIKLLEETVREYKRLGFDLPEKEQKKLKVMLKKASTLAQTFSQNLNEYNDYILCTLEELDGLPEGFIATLPKDVSGKYMVTLQFPHITPFMDFATNRAKRKELATKNLRKGGKQNLKLIKELVALRKQISALLGYKNYADFKTEDRMAKTGEVAEIFINDLLKKLIQPAAKDMTELRAHAKTLGIEDLNYYDLAFVTADLKKKLYQVDPEEIREYFPLPHVMNEMFAHFGKLFGIKFNRKEWKTWHKDVMVYEVTNTDKSLVGYILFDSFPRQGKYGHFCCVDTVIAHEDGWKTGKAAVPVTVNVCNYQAPSKNKPSLLSIYEVEVVFHEFGHGLHMTLSKARHESQSGSNVAWDFVETPSQIMENWVWNDEMLKKLSKHYKTGKSLPKDVRENILAGKRFQSGYANMRQLITGKIDLDYHMDKIQDPTEAYRSMNKLYFGLEYPEKDTLFPAGFGHMAGGYDAGYYSYMWALVYAQDAFSVFEKEGITNPKVGMRWRTEVLEKGSSVDELQLMKNFLGRKPSNKAFLKELGMK